MLPAEPAHQRSAYLVIWSYKMVRLVAWTALMYDLSLFFKRQVFQLPLLRPVGEAVLFIFQFISLSKLMAFCIFQMVFRDWFLPWCSAWRCICWYIHHVCFFSEHSPHGRHYFCLLIKRVLVHLEVCECEDRMFFLKRFRVENETITFVECTIVISNTLSGFYDIISKFIDFEIS